MKSRFICLLAAFVFFPFTALAADFETRIDLLYFSSDDRRIASHETEYAEKNLSFRYEGNEKKLAQELADDELAQGNVCLMQLQQDLFRAERKGQVEDFCDNIFSQEFDSAFARKRQKSHMGVCEARVEVYNEGKQLKSYLVFLAEFEERGSAAQKRVNSSIGRGYFTSPKRTMAKSENQIGPTGKNWKELLKSGSCSFAEEDLAKMQKSYLAQSKERKALARCNFQHRRDREDLLAMERSLSNYVPEEWIAKDAPFLRNGRMLASDEVGEFEEIKECRREREALRARMEKLSEASEKLADRHELPALRFREGRAGRILSSEID